MAGIKGRSGRKPRHIEAIQKKVVEMSWEFLEKVMKDSRLDEKEKIRIAKDICVRSMPQNVKTEHSFTFANMIKIAFSDD